MGFIELILYVLAVVVAPVLEIFSISGMIGFYIVYFGSLCMETLFSVIGCVFTILGILFGDFMVFLQEVAFDISCVLCYIATTVSYSAECIYYFIIYVEDLIANLCSLPVVLCHWIVSMCENILSLAVNAAEQFKAALTLLGTGIWLAMLFVPYSLLSTAEFLTFSCLEVMYKLYLGVMSMVEFIFSGLYVTAVKVIHYFVDIPVTALTGLVTGALLVWLLYDQQEAVKDFMYLGYRYNLDLVRFFVQSVKVTFQKLFRQIEVYGLHWFRRSRAQNGELEENILNTPATSSFHENDCKDLSKLRSRLEKELEEKLCSVCQARRKTVIVLPCRHLCMCEECVFIVERMSQKCPLCRRHIVKTMGVYL